MKLMFSILIIMLCCTCKENLLEEKTNTISIQGTWKLLNGTLIEKGDTTITDYTVGKSFIKVINGDHFAFMSHDLKKGIDSSTAMYSSGGGNYTLENDQYSEHLEYCSAREWENNTFHFTVSFQGDTLIQQGIEKIDSLKIDRMNIEKYKRL